MQSSAPRIQKRWPKWVGIALLCLLILVGSVYAFLFIRIVPPRSVRVVDAITGKPLGGMNVCIQAVDRGWRQQALQSDLGTTNSNGRALFGPSVLNLALLQTLRRGLPSFHVSSADPGSR